MRLLEEDLKFIQENLGYAVTWRPEVFCKYGDVEIKGSRVGEESIHVILEGITVYSSVLPSVFYDNADPKVTWHYDSPSIKKAIAPAVRECSSAIHQFIEARKAKEKEHWRKVAEKKRAFRSKWGIEES